MNIRTMIYWHDFVVVYYFKKFFGGLKCGVLVPQPGIEHMPLPFKAHWTAREVPIVS